MKNLVILFITTSLLAGTPLMAQTNDIDEIEKNDNVKTFKKIERKKPVLKVKSQEQKANKNIEVKNHQYKSQSLKTRNLQSRDVKKPVKLTRQVIKINPLLLKSFKKESFEKKEDKRVLKAFKGDFKTSDNSNISSTTKQENGQFCTYTTLDTNLTTKSFKDFTVNGPPDWLKPGIIIDAVSFVQGSNQIEERYERGPITIALPGSSKPPVTIDNPRKKSNITRAISSLLSTDRSKVHGANLTYSYSEVQSLDELNYKVNGRYSNSFYGIAAKLGMTSNSEKSHHYYLVEFQQTLFSLEVDGLDKTDIFPNNRDLNLGDYVYISKVNYGRKGYFMLKSEKSLEEFGVNAEVSASYMGHNAAVKSNLEKISSAQSTEVEAFYYGGTMKGVIADLAADWEQEGRKPLEDYINDYKFSEAEAYPVSYELKNLDNESVGMKSENSQTIKTCVDSNTIKLKVTLVELQCDTSGDSDRIGDFGITQHIRYEANGKVLEPIRKRINKFQNNQNCDPGSINKEWDGATALICGNKNRQIQVTESKYPKRRNHNINNSIIFEITPEQANDRYAEMIIDTWVKEYSNNDVVMNRDARKSKVAIHEVLGILKGIKEINDDENGGSKFFDGGVSQSLYFDHFDNNSIPLRNVGNPGNIILEGPIRARNRGTDLNQKAFIWMQFQLVE